MKSPLTRVQRQVLEFIQETIDAEGVAPTQDEIRTRFGWSSLGTVSKHLDRLERGGHIRRVSQLTRGIAVVDEVDSRLFVAEGLPDARELLERIVRNLPEVLSLPAAGLRLRSAMQVFGLDSTHAARLLWALGHDPVQQVGCTKWEALEDIFGSEVVDELWWEETFGVDPPPKGERRRRYAHRETAR